MPEIAAIIGIDADFSKVIQKANTLSGQIKPLVLRLDDNRFTGPLGSIRGGLQQFNKALDASNARVISFGASAGILYSFVRAFTSIAKSTIDVNKSLTEIGVILNTSSEGLNKFGNSLFDIAKGTGQSFKVVSQAALELSRQGLSVEETLKRTRDALILTRFTNLDAASAVETLTTAINSFDKAALTSTQIINKLFNVDTQFAVSSRDLAEALSRVGSTAQDAGVGIDSLIGLVTSAKQITGRDGPVIGNSLKTIFQRLQRPEVLSQLEKLGVLTRDTADNLLPVDQILIGLARTYDTLSQAQQNQVTQLAAGVFQANIFKALLNDLAKANSVYTGATNASTNATSQAIQRNEEMNKSLSALVNESFANLTKAGASIGKDVFEPFARRGLSIINALTSGFNFSEPEGFGEKIGSGILKGIGSFLAGPGAIAILGILGKLTFKFTKDIAKDIGDLSGINRVSQERANIEKLISSTINSEPAILARIQAGETSILNISNAVLSSLRERLLLSERIASISTIISKSSIAQNILRTVPNKQEITAKIPSGKIASEGFIPNYNNPLSDAIQREKSAGIPESLIKVSKSLSLKSPLNPQGLGVYNSKNEPRGLSQGIDRVKNMGLDPKKAGVYNKGLIPNYALIKAYHGTYSDFQKFGKGDIGFHFGSKETANYRLGTDEASIEDYLKSPQSYNISSLKAYKEGARIIPVNLNLKNPLKIRDINDFDRPYNVLNELLKQGTITENEIKNNSKLNYMYYGSDVSPKNYEEFKPVRNLLRKKGYDSLVYENRYEKGGLSYIAFYPSQIKSQFEKNKGLIPNYALIKAYHGTTSDYFKRFKSSDIGIHFGTIEHANQRLLQTAGSSIHTQPSEYKNVNYLEGSRIIPTLLDIKNPLRLNDTNWSKPGFITDQLLDKKIITDKELKELFYKDAPYYNFEDLVSNYRIGKKSSDFKPLRNFIKSKGYDSIVYKNEYETLNYANPQDDSYIVFNNSQIKSAITGKGFNKGLIPNFANRPKIPGISASRGGSEPIFEFIDVNNNAKNRYIDYLMRIKGMDENSAIKQSRKVYGNYGDIGRGRNLESNYPILNKGLIPNYALIKAHHGTNKNYQKLERQEQNPSHILPFGIHLSESINTAKKYGNRIINASLNLRKIYDATGKSDTISKEIAGKRFKEGMTSREALDAGGRAPYNMTFAEYKLEQLGYDSIKYKDKNKKINYVVFDPKQIDIENELFLPSKIKNKGLIPNFTPEQIKFAAIKYKNKIFTGKAHFEALNKIEYEFPEDFIKNPIPFQLRNSESYGFITSLGKFVNRGEAERISGYEIAEDIKSINKSSGLIPIKSSLKEKLGAYQGGYTPGQVKETNIKGLGKVIYNTAEKIRKFPGLEQPAIIPPKQSKAGINYKEKFIKTHGFNPYLAKEYVPNYNKIFSTQGKGLYDRFNRNLLPTVEKAESEILKSGLYIPEFPIRTTFGGYRKQLKGYYHGFSRFVGKGYSNPSIELFRDADFLDTYVPKHEYGHFISQLAGYSKGKRNLGEFFGHVRTNKLPNDEVFADIYNRLVENKVYKTGPNSKYADEILSFIQKFRKGDFGSVGELVEKSKIGGFSSGLIPNYKKEFETKHGFDPYFNKGLVPNFLPINLLKAFKNTRKIPAKFNLKLEDEFLRGIYNPSLIELNPNSRDLVRNFTHELSHSFLDKAGLTGILSQKSNKSSNLLSSSYTAKRIKQGKYNKKTFLEEFFSDLQNPQELFEEKMEFLEKLGFNRRKSSQIIGLSKKINQISLERLSKSRIEDSANITTLSKGLIPNFASNLHGLKLGINKQFQTKNSHAIKDVMAKQRLSESDLSDIAKFFKNPILDDSRIIRRQPSRFGTLNEEEIEYLISSSGEQGLRGLRLKLAVNPEQIDKSRLITILPRHGIANEGLIPNFNALSSAIQRENSAGIPNFVKINVNSIGKKLSSKFFLNKGENAYNQADSNCADIALYLAREFGFAAPINKAKIAERIDEIRLNKLYGGKKINGSLGNLIVREPEDLGRAHVAFEYKNKEINFGPGTKEGFTISTRIPLDKLFEPNPVLFENKLISKQNIRNKGLIPNFNALSQAISRENSAGIPLSQIKVGQSNILKSSLNPMGLGVYNTKDEPLGLNQGIKRTKSMGLDPKRAGVYNKGLVPSFAPPKFITDPTTFKPFTPIEKRQELGKVIDEFKNSIKKGKIAFDQVAPKVEELSSSFNLTSKGSNRLLQSFNQTYRTFETQQFEQLKSKAGGVFFSNKKFEEAMKGRRYTPEQQAELLNQRNQRSQAIQNRALITSFVAPMIGETLAQLAGNRTATQRGIGATASGLGSAASYGALAASFNLGPLGIGAAAGFGLLTSLPKIIEGFTDTLPDLQREFERLSEKTNRTSEALAGYLKVSEQLSEVYNGQTKATKGFVDQLQSQQKEFFLKLPTQNKEEFARLIKGGNLQEAIRLASNIRKQGEQQKNVTGFGISLNQFNKQISPFGLPVLKGILKSFDERRQEDIQQSNLTLGRNPFTNLSIFAGYKPFAKKADFSEEIIKNEKLLVEQADLFKNQLLGSRTIKGENIIDFLTQNPKVLNQIQGKKGEDFLNILAKAGKEQENDVLRANILQFRSQNLDENVVNKIINIVSKAFTSDELKGAKESVEAYQVSQIEVKKATDDFTQKLFETAVELESFDKTLQNSVKSTIQSFNAFIDKQKIAAAGFIDFQENFASPEVIVALKNLAANRQIQNERALGIRTAGLELGADVSQSFGKAFSIFQEKTFKEETERKRASIGKIELLNTPGASKTAFEFAAPFKQKIEKILGIQNIEEVNNALSELTNSVLKEKQAVDIKLKGDTSNDLLRIQSEFLANLFKDLTTSGLDYKFNLEKINQTLSENLSIEKLRFNQLKDQIAIQKYSTFGGGLQNLLGQDNNTIRNIIGANTLIRGGQERGNLLTQGQGAFQLADIFKSFGADIQKSFPSLFKTIIQGTETQIKHILSVLPEDISLTDEEGKQLSAREIATTIAKLNFQTTKDQDQLLKDLSKSIPLITESNSSLATNLSSSIGSLVSQFQSQSGAKVFVSNMDKFTKSVKNAVKEVITNKENIIETPKKTVLETAKTTNITEIPDKTKLFLQSIKVNKFDPFHDINLADYKPIKTEPKQKLKSESKPEANTLAFLQSIKTNKFNPFERVNLPKETIIEPSFIEKINSFQSGMGQEINNIKKTFDELNNLMIDIISKAESEKYFTPTQPDYGTNLPKINEEQRQLLGFELTRKENLSPLNKISSPNILGGYRFTPKGDFNESLLYGIEAAKGREKLSTDLGTAIANLRIMVQQGTAFSDEIAKAVDDVNDLNIRLGDFNKVDIKEAFFGPLRYGAKEFARDFKDEIKSVGTDFKSGLSGALKDLVRGKGSIGEVFREAALNFLYKRLDFGIDQTVNQLGNLFAGLFKGKSGGMNVNQGDNTGATVASTIGSVIAAFFGSKGKYQGGIIKRYSEGGLVTGGSGVKDDVPALLTEGEYVISKAAIERIKGSDTKYREEQKENRLRFIKYSEVANKPLPSLVREFSTSTSSGISALFRNAFVYNDPRRPTSAAMQYDRRLSEFALMDENNPQNANRLRREETFYSYIKELNDYIRSVKRARRHAQSMKETALYTSVIMAVVGGALGALVKKGGTGTGSAGEPTGPGGSYYHPPKDIGHYYYGGLIKGYAMGGRVFGGQSPTDNIPTMLTGGEYVVKKDIVRKFGKDYFDRINYGTKRGYAEGGLVGSNVGLGINTEDISNYILKLIDITTSLRETINKNIQGTTAVNNGQTNRLTPQTNTEEGRGVIVNSSITINIDKNGNVNSNIDNKTNQQNNNQEDIRRNRELTKLIEAQSTQTIIENLRPGGLLYSNRERS